MDLAKQIDVPFIRDSSRILKSNIKIPNVIHTGVDYLVERVFEMISQNPEALYHFSSLLFSKMHEENDEEEIPVDNG
jgi:hypothetical protein